MSEQHDGGPAFPVSTSDPRVGHQDGNNTWQFPGLSVRDYFAAKAMQSMVATGGYAGLQDLARSSYEFSDAMLKERSK